jgi:putative NADPH-quinone reductase
MSKRIVMIIGHPDATAERFCRHLANAYAEGAVSGGHEVKTIDVATLAFPVLRTRDEWENGRPVASIAATQQTIGWADHLVIVFPLWLGGMPALLKAFLEQTLRPGFALPKGTVGLRWKKRLAGKSARIVVTMGMPAVLYRVYFRAHSVKSLERNILKFCGISPVRESLIGLVEADKVGKREAWLGKMRALGARGV